MVLTAPLMLLGLLAVPLLVAVYWFRTRSRRIVVSSLMLWTDQRSPRQGGRLLQRMQTPLAFFLEMLAIVLLVLGAAGPAVVKKETSRPLVVVLDDSYSMLAEADGRPSPRMQAGSALTEELRRDNYQVRLLVAGAEPRLLGQPQPSADDLDPLLAAWTCQGPWADLERAVSLAGEIGGANARILVLTDHPPPMKLKGGAVQWWAFGSPLPNMAITAAVRSPSAENERALVEVTNLSDAPGRTTVTLEGGNLKVPKKLPVDLAAGAARQLFLDLPAGSPALEATLDGDALTIDNKVVLLPGAAPPVRVRVDIADSGLRDAVTGVLKATGMALEVTERPDLVVSDRDGGASGDAWRLEILAAKDPVAYAGPFVIERTHPLAQGLSLEGAIWSAAPKAELSGPAIITAGNVTLLTDREDNSGRHRLQMNFVREVSNLQDTPDWPILFDNLLRWRRGERLGATAPNVRLGQTVTVTLPDDAKQVELVPPVPPAKKLDVHNRRVEVAADRIGVFTIKSSGTTYRFAASATSRDESDLSGAETGRWGDWNGSAIHRDRQVSIRWAVLLLAMTGMAAHLVLIAESGRRGNP
jgi:hypothetical protein